MNGKERQLPCNQLLEKTSDKDPEIRRKAAQSLAKSFEDNKRPLHVYYEYAR